jgi:shikimate dehydrogenase
MGIPYAEVIGDPIAHSKSPLIHKFWLEKLGIEGDYRAARVTSDELADYFTARRADPDWRGCNVTIPHKQAVTALLDRNEDSSVGAVNCVVPREGRLIGRNTDIAGIDQALTKWVDTRAPVCIIGAGGGARAAISSLDFLAVYRFNLIARDQESARLLLEPYAGTAQVYDFDQAEEALAGCVGVINATPLGMTGFPDMPEAVLGGLAGVRRGSLALDMVYTPLETAFLARARQERLSVIDGLTVLIGQASDAFFHFFRAAAPRQHDFELRAGLTR